MRLACELGRPHVGHPDLDGTQPLGTKPTAVLTYPPPAARFLVRRGHEPMLHVTTVVLLLEAETPSAAEAPRRAVGADGDIGRSQISSVFRCSERSPSRTPSVRRDPLGIVRPQVSPTAGLWRQANSFTSERSCSGLRRSRSVLYTYTRRMPRMQVYLPDDLYRAVKERDLPASELLQSAVRAELRRQALLEETDRYLAELIDEVGEPSPKAVARAEALSRRIRRQEPASRSA